MTEFQKTRWAEADFSRNYVESADIAIVERQRSHAIMKSFYRYHCMGGDRTDVLDLGCGDGILTDALMQTDNTLSATLVDGSEEMLNKSSERLKGCGNVRFIKASFQDIVEGNSLKGTFDFIISSHAIHHLDLKEKRGLFRWIYSHTKNGGHFLNIDVVLAPNDDLEAWYMALWQEWIAEKKALTGIAGDIYDDTMRRYKDNKDNKPDTLEAQLDALKTIGFKNVDCYYKYGIFTMYGGRK
jgi:tRNA (cmo5U34)-methyltransferase